MMFLVMRPKRGSDGGREAEVRDEGRMREDGGWEGPRQTEDNMSKSA